MTLACACSDVVKAWTAGIGCKELTQQSNEPNGDLQDGLLANKRPRRECKNGCGDLEAAAMCQLRGRCMTMVCSPWLVMVRCDMTGR